MREKIYLNVSYSQKDAAKVLGAKWDSTIKKWYYEGDTKNFYQFGKWLPAVDIIAYEQLYIIKGSRICYKCHKPTTVIGIGIGEHSVIYEDDGKYIIDEPVDDEEIHLAWFDCEEDIPPYLLNYLKSNYNVKTVFSKFQKSKCFANCCEHCNALQGNNFLFNETSPLNTDCEGKELIDRMEKLDIYILYIDEALPLNLELSYCENDWAYVKYCTFHNLTDDYITFAEMYALS